MNIDELSPATIGEEKIDLSVDPSSLPVRVGRVTQLNVSYARCSPVGTALPLEMIVQGPTIASYVERSFRRNRPTQLLFVPVEAGAHRVLLRELYHNRWLGILRLDVAGDRSEVS